jgi:hypothetical protein
MKYDKKVINIDKPFVQNNVLPDLFIWKKTPMD